VEKNEADRFKASLFDLAPDGVCLAITLAWNAVGSYPTISPLPLSALGALGRYIFCGTFLHPPFGGRLGVIQHPVLRSSDFPQPDGETPPIAITDLLLGQIIRGKTGKIQRMKPSGKGLLGEMLVNTLIGQFIRSFIEFPQHMRESHHF
jgi:hypothetical protein